MENRTYTYIAIGLGVAILLVFVIGAILGWFKAGQLKLVQGDGNVDRTATGAIDETRYTSIAKQVKDGLSGLNWQSSYFNSVADQLLALNNNELRLTSNIYLRKFGDSEFPTLRAKIQGEWLGGWGNPCTENEKGVINSPCYKQDKLIKRLTSINA